MSGSKRGRVARIVWEDWGEPEVEWEDAEPSCRRDCLEMADRILASLVDPEEDTVWALVIDLADELEAELYARYRPDDDLHPAMESRFNRDMETVRRARKATVVTR